MFQTQKVNATTVAVTYDATDVCLRKSGKEYYRTEESAVVIKDKEVILHTDVLKKFGFKITFA